VTQYAATPRVQSGCGCLCKPPVADSFSPGTTAAIGPLSGMGDANYREVRTKGLPPILRMGKLAGFLGAMGDDGLDLVGMDTGSLVSPDPVFLPQVADNSGNIGLMPYLSPDSPLLNLSSSPTGSLVPYSPTNLAQIPNNVTPATSQPGTSIAASSINAAAAALKAASGSPTGTMTPAQIAALQKSTALNLGTSQWFAGIPNQDVLMLGAAAALLVVLTAGKK
jgi:hypothetical protein